MAEISNSNFTVHRIISEDSETYLANNDYSRVLQLGINSLQASRLYCDVTLEAGNVSFPAHKVVLAATSVYFRMMFSQNFQESLSNVVKYPDISPAVMEAVLTFVYSGKVQISKDSVKDILKMAHLLDLNLLIEACYLYLKRNLSPKNAVATLHLSKLYGFTDLTASSLKCIVDHFNKVGENILKLTSYELLEVIRNEELFLYHEDDVLRVVTNWIKFNKEENDAMVFNLMKSVRISVCSHELVSKLLLKNNQEPFHSSFIETIEYCMTLSHPGRSYKVPALFMLGGRGSVLSFVRLDLNTKEYSELPSLPSPREGHGCALFGRKVYVIGGGWTMKVDCYDLDKNCWLSCSPTSERRINSVIVELDGMIYACGGWDGTMASKSVERYDPEKDEWTKVASMINPHGYSCGAVVNGRIYIIGSKVTVGAYSTFCEYYDPVENSWKSFTPIPESIRLARASAVQGALFVTGGTMVYKYDVDTDAWSSCPRMPVPRYSHISCALFKKIYVIGGFSRNSSDDLSVLIFDTTLSTWTKETVLKSKISSFAGCFVL